VIPSAVGSDEALSVAAAHPGAIDLLLTDVVLPGVTGPALAARLRERHPAMRVLFMSGYGVEILAKYGAELGDDAFLTKPMSQGALRECVARLLETP
jgi:two-component system, cell cycle sensor histidine kinase and response regulator CckA